VVDGAMTIPRLNRATDWNPADEANTVPVW
jgi:Mg2+/Co2+ transporter CorB